MSMSFVALLFRACGLEWEAMDIQLPTVQKIVLFLIRPQFTTPCSYVGEVNQLALLLR